MFKQDHPDCRISRARFARLRPDSVHPFTKHSYTACLCDQCAKLELKIEAWNKLVKKMGQPEFYLSLIDEVSAITMCHIPEGWAWKHHQRPCIERECTDCRVHVLDVYLGQFWQQFADEEIKFLEWHNEALTTAKGKVSSRIVKATVTMSTSDFVEVLSDEVHKISRHLFTHR